ncbi:unnamed protein product [Phytomonas sp. EM1]|nr:unnamed protein product [Phytomonas sp. EM1]|eukprot:CCW65499.1 unnamed protein product [Phytomonas sp. isolate EM1]
MRRKGGRVVSFAKETIFLDEEPANFFTREEVVLGIETSPPAPSSSSSLSSSSSPSRWHPSKRTLDKGDVTTTSVAASSLDIFSRFQSHNGDFEAKWLLLEDDLPVDAGKPPISEELLDKLKLSQRRIGTTRNARADGLNEKLTPATMGGQETNISDGKPLAEPRRGSQPPLSDGDRSAIEPQTNAKGRSEERERGAAAAALEEGGIRGDYLLFSTASSRQGAGTAAGLSVNQLQASVAISPKSEVNDRAASRGFLDRIQGASLPSPSTSDAPSLSRMVPLWSVARMEKEGGYCADSPLVALHQEITDLVDYLRPTQAEVSIRRMIEMEISRIARRLWPDCEPIVYGSLYTQLMLPLSDVDITITNVPIAPEEALTVLAREISQAGLCDAAYPQLILKTKVPLVKFQHKGSLVDVDISINAGDGKKNSDIVHALLANFPEAQPLIVVIKYFLQQRDMAEPYRGGLGSYATTLLVISFLQSHPIHTTRPEERAVSGLGRLLVDFFRFYGMYWNYHQCGVSVEKGRMFFPREDDLVGFSPTSPSSPRSPSGPAQAWIEDPGNPANNAASSLRNFHVISSLFSHAYFALTAELPPPSSEELSEQSPAAASLSRRPTVLSRILHVDANMVWKRLLIAEAYDTLCAERAAFMAEVREYRRMEDGKMLAGVGGVLTPQKTATSGEYRTLASLVASARGRAAGEGPSTAKESFDSGVKPAGKRRREGVNDADDHGEDGRGSGSSASSTRREGDRGMKRRSRSRVEGTTTGRWS